MNTPILEMKEYAKRRNLKARIFAKLEFLNLAGSVKDRVALAMLEDAERRGILKAGSTIVEPTSGNTGIALAAFGRMRGYHVRICMPENMSEARKKLLRAYGARLVETPQAEGMHGAILRAKAYAAAGEILLGQFENPANPRAHYLSTGPEIARYRPDVFVCGVGTGGTVTGVGKYFKERFPAVEIVAVQPASSPVLTGGKAGPHAIAGIGAGFVPPVLDMTAYDTVLDVTDGEAFEAKEGALDDGLFVGISSGAVLAAATALARQNAYEGKKIAVLFADGGARYL